MSRILTIRIDDALREMLERRAREQGRTMSDLTREILTAALAELPLSERTRHLRGVLDAIDNNRRYKRTQLAERSSATQLAGLSTSRLLEYAA